MMLSREAVKASGMMFATCTTTTTCTATQLRLITRTPRRLVHRVAVVGSGPAGFYTAYKLLQTTSDVEVDLLEALPIPYGLVRFGVAPDHPEVKSVQNKFDEVAQDPRFAFIGNVRVGTGATSIAALRERYHALVLAYGAGRDRRLSIAGESSLSGIYGARDFVGWYNGLPHLRRLDPDLERGEEAVVVGQGNVALDVARILLTPVEVLAKTDITAYALEKLAKSRVKRVHIVGRRGAPQVSFTAKEFREMFAIDGAQFQVEAANVRSSIAQMADQLANDRPRKRLMSLIETHATTKSLPLPEDPVADGRARAAWSLRFNLAPRAFIPDAKDATRLGAVEFERTIVDPHNGRASGTGTTEHIPASLVFRSIGYEIIPVPGVPFDQQLNHVPHAQGRVTVDSSEGAAVISGLYVAGWLKRGPSGVIAATMYDAFQTAATIAADLAPSSDAAASSSLPVTLKPTREETIAWLTRVQPTRPVTFDDWKKIEAEERRRGEALGKPREKMTSLKEIYELLGIASDGPWNDAGGVKGNDDASRKEKK